MNTGEGNVPVGEGNPLLNMDNQGPHLLPEDNNTSTSLSFEDGDEDVEVASFLDLNSSSSSTELDFVPATPEPAEPVASTSSGTPFAARGGQKRTAAIYDLHSSPIIILDSDDDDDEEYGEMHRAGQMHLSIDAVRVAQEILRDASSTPNVPETVNDSALASTSTSSAAASGSTSALKFIDLTKMQLGRGTALSKIVNHFKNTSVSATKPCSCGHCKLHTSAAGGVVNSYSHSSVINGEKRKQWSLAELESKAKQTHNTVLQNMIATTKKILKTGIPIDTPASQHFQDALCVLNTLKNSIPFELLGSTVDKEKAALTLSTASRSTVVINGDDINLKPKPLSKFDVRPGEITPINEAVVDVFGNLFTNWKTILQADLSYRELTREKLRAMFNCGIYISDSRANDRSLFERYKPIQLVGHLLSYYLLELLSGEFSTSIDLARRLKKLLTTDIVYQKEKYQQVYSYLDCINRAFFQTVFIAKNKSSFKLPSYEDWDSDLRDKMSLVGWYVERTVRLVNKPHLPPASIVVDVEWLLEFLTVLQDRRLKGLYPNTISQQERDYVKKAFELDPQNPFVILCLLESISCRVKKLSLNFETTCRNLVDRFPRSFYIHLQISKFFLQKADRNRYTGIEYLKRAVVLNPNDTEVNMMCAKYLCPTMGESGMKYRDSCLRTAMTTDLSNFKATFEYFANSLGFRKTQVSDPEERNSLFDIDSAPTNDNVSEESSMRPVTRTAAVIDMMTKFGERYSLSLDAILTSTYAKAWSDIKISKLNVLSMFNYYLYSEFGEALEVLLTIYKKNEIICMIKNMDILREKYGWNQKLNFVSFRRWLATEYEDILQLDREDRIDLREQMLASGESFSDTDDENDINENMQNDDDDPIREMLGYLLQIF